MGDTVYLPLLDGPTVAAEVVKPGITRTSDLVWWWRQQVNDLGLGTWFQPSIEVQRAGATEESLGSDPIIQRGDVLWCDVGIVAMGLATDTQHNGYVLLPEQTRTCLLLYRISLPIELVPEYDPALPRRAPPPRCPPFA